MIDLFLLLKQENEISLTKFVNHGRKLPNKDISRQYFDP